MEQVIIRIDGMLAVYACYFSFGSEFYLRFFLDTKLLFLRPALITYAMRAYFPSVHDWLGIKNVYVVNSIICIWLIWLYKMESGQTLTSGYAATAKCSLTSCFRLAVSFMYSNLVMMIL